MSLGVDLGKNSDLSLTSNNDFVVTSIVVQGRGDQNTDITERLKNLRISVGNTDPADYVPATTSVAEPVLNTINPGGFKLVASDDTPFTFTPPSRFPGEIRTYSKAALGPDEFVEATGRYVSIQLVPAGKVLSLVDVKVYGYSASAKAAYDAAPLPSAPTKK
ncbi:hypothetical protein FOA52_014008 [Chlamydomonas sp. UWO 241]|nr:hypothetical protein FOA52_014008 [Chlamydomonas sp. UWO 241]